MQTPHAKALARREGISGKIIIIVVIAVAIVGIAAAAFFFMSMFKPPVDISATPQLSESLNPMSMIPPQLAGQTLQGNTDLSTYHDVSYRASYGSFYVVIGRATTSGVADSIIGDSYDSLTGGSGTFMRSGNWFAVDTSGNSYIGWNTGAWLYIVRADDSGTRNQVTQELISYLNQHSS